MNDFFFLAAVQSRFFKRWTRPRLCLVVKGVSGPPAKLTRTVFSRSLDTSQGVKAQKHYSVASKCVGMAVFFKGKYRSTFDPPPFFLLQLNHPRFWAMLPVQDVMTHTQPTTWAMLSANLVKRSAMLAYMEDGE